MTDGIPAPGRVEFGGAHLAIEGVSKSFQGGAGRVQAVDSVSFEVPAGSSLCLVGPSGSGKSTILNIIAGLERPDRGRVLMDGQPIRGPGRDRMVMFQESALFPWLDVLGNVLFGLELTPGLDRAERTEVAMRYLRMVRLERFARARVHELSGGMKQRVALARALAPNPRVLLMDEPFSALDALTREQLYADLQEIWHTQRRTMIFVTHNVREAICLGDRVILLSPSPGRLHQAFPVDLPSPRDINSVEVARCATEVAAALRGLIPKDGAVT